MSDSGRFCPIARAVTDWMLHSGGNLAAILTLYAASLTPVIPLVFQLLIVPVTDNSISPSDPSSTWHTNRHTPWLTPARMVWFRNNYLPSSLKPHSPLFSTVLSDDSQESDLTKRWSVSPLYAPSALLALTPRAWIGIAELDILRGEAEAYATKLKECGVEVEVSLYKGAPHPIMAMDGKFCVLCSRCG